jgi:hypothetical protein
MTVCGMESRSIAAEAIPSQKIKELWEITQSSLHVALSLPRVTKSLGVAVVPFEVAVFVRFFGHYGLKTPLR